MRKSTQLLIRVATLVSTCPTCRVTWTPVLPPHSVTNRQTDVFNILPCKTIIQSQVLMLSLFKRKLFTALISQNTIL